jgi:hypothetical protein
MHDKIRPRFGNAGDKKNVHAPLNIYELTISYQRPHYKEE